jgi:hypothetical protein
LADVLIAAKAEKELAGEMHVTIPFLGRRPQAREVSLERLISENSIPEKVL